MTAATELNVNAIILQAYQLAGLLNYAQTLDQKRGAYARPLLGTILNHLEAQSIQVRRVDFVYVTLTAGVGEYQFAAGDAVLDVFGPAAYIQAGETDLERPQSETRVSAIDRVGWQEISSKAAQGRPNLYYADRYGTLIKVQLWPEPTEAGTVRFQVQTIAPTANDGAGSVALELPWEQFFIWELAHQLAVAQGKPLQKCQYLASKADEKLKACIGFSNEHTGSQLVLDHDTGYR